MNTKAIFAALALSTAATAALPATAQPTYDNRAYDRNDLWRGAPDGFVKQVDPPQGPLGLDPPVNGEGSPQQGIPSLRKPEHHKLAGSGSRQGLAAGQSDAAISGSERLVVKHRGKGLDHVFNPITAGNRPVRCWRR